MEIKLATKNDIEKINKLYKELFYDMAKLQPEYLREAEQETPPYNCFINQRYVYLLDLIVINIHRGNGIGSELLRKVKEWEKVRNLDYVELNVLPENSEVIKLYEKKDLKILCKQ